MTASKTLLHGTLEALVLKTLSHGPLHGYAIARWIEERTQEALQIEEGSLYPALYRLESKGLLTAEWGTSELGRRAKFYSLTPKGRARLAAEVKAWSDFSAAVTEVLAGEA
jgi:PadR family transcriptional regulator PadR